jgi:uncharacterized protein (TIGR01319 family)
MMVAGVVKSMTAESAERAALGGGAIVMDVIASNDGRFGHEKIEQIRQLRPDMILLSGGTDGGTITHVVELAEYIAAAEPKPRFGQEYQLPIIYAGNNKARGEITRVLQKKTALFMVDNLRPVLEKENLGPARHKIHELFLTHVMAQAPGYDKLIKWTSAPIMPTPSAVGLIMELIAKEENLNILGVDIGGATTDTFSVIKGNFNRTVSANLGMSYSISNVLVSAGVENIKKWLEIEVLEDELLDRIKNKMIRPTTIPQTLEELKIEQAIAREALQLAFEQHKLLAVGLKGVQQKRSISDVFDQSATGKSLIDMFELDLIIGSGGILSHAPRRQQAMMMMIDAYQPVGITRLAVDSIFMMPHLGVLSTVQPRAAIDVFKADCLIFLGTCVAPQGQGKEGEPCFRYQFKYPSGESQEGELLFGQIKCLPLGKEEEVLLEVFPHHKFNFGLGKGKAWKKKVKGGVVGLVLDARGRPLVLSLEEEKRKKQLADWQISLNLYPEDEKR